MTKDIIESRSLAKDLFEKLKTFVFQSVENKDIDQEDALLYNLTN